MNFAIAILYAVSSSTLLAVALSFFRGGLSPLSAAISISFGLLVASATAWSGRRSSAAAQPPSPWEWAAIVTFALVCLRIFLWVVIVQGDDIKVLSPNNLGDLSLHLTYIRYLASGVSFWPDNPIFTGAPLTYPIGVDFFHSLLTLLGLDVFRGFVWIGLAGSFLTGAALWRWGRGFAVFGFLANGGLFAFAIFSNWKLADFQAEFAWKSFALALFATQRGLLFALPAGLFLLSSWRARFFGGDGPMLPRWGEVLLYASLPLFHFHTFLFLSVLLGVWFLMQLVRAAQPSLLSAPDHPLYRPEARRELIVLVAAAFVPATILVWFITGGLHGGHMLGWKPGWMWDDAPFLEWCRANFRGSAETHAKALFWPMNFGALPIFVAALIVVLVRERDTWARAIVFPSLLIFVLCCFVKFAPWEWDNTKLMVWSYLAILPFLWSKLLVEWPAWGRVLAGVVLFSSGFLSTLGGIDGSHKGYSIARRSELDGTMHAVLQLPVNERFAGAPTYNHPLLLCGRKMAMGYLGHVSSHGLDYAQVAAKLNALMNGDPGWRALAEELQVRYLFWGANEEEVYPNSEQPWKEETLRVAFGDWGAIYDLQSPAAPPAATLGISE
jgi:hypothetical protein